jgi:ankyrin repeat protein
MTEKSRKKHEAHGTIRGIRLKSGSSRRQVRGLRVEWRKHFSELTMALELSKQAYSLCRDQNASGLRAFLEEHGADIDLNLHEQKEYLFLRKEYSMWTFNIIGLAAHHESPECLQVLVDFGANVNNQERAFGTTPLMSAAGFGRVKCMRLLLEKNADVALAGINGYMALLRASGRGHSECLRLLIENNADVQCKSDDGYTGLTLAALKGHPGCVRVMMEAKADVNQQCLNGWTGSLLACEKGNVECLRLLIGNKASVDCKNVDGDTGLMVAARKGHPGCVRVMMEAKADVSQQRGNGWTGSLLACEKGNVECLRLLIENKASVDCKNVNGDTGLIMAVYNDQIECVKVMMGAKADVNTRGSNGETVLTYAIEEKHFNYLMALLDHSDGDTPASAGTKAHALRTVLEESEGGLSASEQATAFVLLAHGADIDAAAEEVSENKYSTASMYANTHRFIERWHGIALNALSERVEVDRRVGLGLHGLYQEPLERVLQYLGLSMAADQVVNLSLDDDGRDMQRVLLPNCAHNANHWLQLYQQRRT